MEKEAEDKAIRILSIYSRLKQGKIIFKEEESRRHGVSPRTIQRDIVDVQCFLQNQTNETGEIQEIVFDKSSGGYILQTKSKQQLEGKEILAIAKVLLESRSLMKSELFPMIYKLMGMCSDDSEKKLLEDLLRNEMFHYVELKHGKYLLDRLWELEQAVKNQEYLEIRYQKLNRQELVTRKVKPVGVIFSEFYFYLVAYIENTDKEKEVRKADEIYPAIYRVDRLKSVRGLKEYFSVPYLERFEEGEFRKRIQFMYGGALNRVSFLYKGPDINAVLDRLPSATCKRMENGEFLVKAEVYGTIGIDMWLRSQGEYVERMD